MEDKEGFVRALSAALIEYGGGRYDRLLESPLAYVRRGGEEMVEIGDGSVCVTLDSLPALMGDIARSGLL
ncbi:hypothetical protein [Collinsella bouchesdurhonensis]|uniref:hypothetical protein n=1 Tax=Collinsella bouchesdurhonensis TaxID=1907654 RepID=UPI00356A6663